MQGIRVEGVSKSFGSVQALDGVTLSVDPGEVLVLVGPNGAGKSTLIRILGTTVLPDSGSASMGGRDVTSDPVGARRACGLMLGEERAWYWRISGRRNLEFFCALHGLTRDAGRGRSTTLLDAFGLAEAADRRVGAYSAGMRARLSLARALIADPPFLLLDEPTRNLDPVGSARFRDTVTRLTAERGAAVLLATHELHEAAQLASRTVALSRGRIAFTRPGGTAPDELEDAMVTAV
jgi:ABC-2 type transport system ATP-binding protein